MSDQQEWFYEQNGQQQGPVSSETLKGMSSSGSIPRSAMVWREGMADWIAFDKSELCTDPNLPPAVPTSGPMVAKQPFVPRPARLKADFNFGVFHSLGEGWRVMVADFWPFVGFYALASIIYGVASNLVIPILVGTFPMMGGFMYYTLKRLRNQPGDVDNIFDGFKRRLGSTAVLSFLLLLPFILGLIPIIGAAIYASTNPEMVEANPIPLISFIGAAVLLLLIVTTVVGIICSLAALLCLDCDIGWSKALGLATKAFGKRMFKLIGFAIVASILSYAGVLVFFVGAFVTGTWVVVAFSHIYEQAFGD